MRKRLLCVFLILLLCLSALPAAADTGQSETATAAIRLAVDASDPDGTVSVSVYLDQNPGLTSVKLKVGYDASLLTLVSAESTALIGDWFEVSESVDTNPYVLVWVCADSTTATGAIATLKLRPNSSSSAAEAEISITQSELICEGTDVAATVTGCTVYLQCDHAYGDFTPVDGDQHVRRCTRCHHAEYRPHTWEEGETLKEPTHTAPGERKYICSCGASKIDTAPPTPEHIFQIYPHDAQQHISKCECGYEAFAPHEWDEGYVIQEPTHTSVGFRESICPCGERRTEEIPPVPDHDYQPSGFDEYNHYSECICGEKLVQGHQWNEGKVVQAPTATESGIIRYTCPCGAEKDEIVPPTGASSDSGAVTAPPIQGGQDPGPDESQPGGSSGCAQGCAASFGLLAALPALLLAAAVLSKKKRD